MEKVSLDCSILLSELKKISFFAEEQEYKSKLSNFRDICTNPNLKTYKELEKNKDIGVFLNRTELHDCITRDWKNIYVAPSKFEKGIHR